jgi:predicted glutamine amidotransferase
VVKSPSAAYRQPGRFKRAAAAESRIAIGHIRHASNPKGLPKRALLGLENSQPFTDGPFAFAHNGTLNHPDAIAARLGPLRGRVRGVNDSEVFFYQFLKFLRIKGDAARAFEACLEELWSVPRPDDRPPHAGVNVVASDGEALFAFCHYPETSARAFCSPAPWGRMAYLDAGDRLVVASERLGRSWRMFDDLQAMTAWRKDGRIRIEFKKVRVPRVKAGAMTRSEETLK